MDPIANMNEQLSIARATIAAAEQIGAGDDIDFTVSDESLRLAELVIALDEWRRNGGFDPYKRSIQVVTDCHEYFWLNDDVLARLKWGHQNQVWAGGRWIDHEFNSLTDGYPISARQARWRMKDGRIPSRAELRRAMDRWNQTDNSDDKE